jgi:molybdopterin-guanine dinucleotide biosynthesis protein B
MNNKILGICGYSGSGKTTLIKVIVKILSSKGYKIGTIKHTHHDFEFDKPGKDSYEHFHSGALSSMIISDNKMGFVKRGEEMNPENLVKKYFSDCELVIIEGFKNYENIPKIEVYRKEIGKKPLYTELSNCIAIITNEKMDTSIIQLSINDIDNIAKFIETRFL